jgi:hypothetical protein
MRLSAHRLALSAAWVFALGLSCSTGDSEGISVRVHLEPTGDASAPLTTDTGYEVTLTRGYLVTASADLEVCAADALWLRRLERRATWVKSAHAHESGTPTHIGSPYVEALVGGGTTPVDYGVFSPPPDRYCTLRYDIGPADSDAEGLPADPDMVGKSLYLEGTYTAADGVAHAFTASTSATATAELGLSTLDLQSAGTADVLVRKSAAHWFDGIDFAAATPDDIATKVLANIGVSATATVE